MRVKTVCLFALMAYASFSIAAGNCLSRSCIDDNAAGDLASFMSRHGALVIPYSFDQDRRQMNVEAVLCKSEAYCFSSLLEFDSGDPNNHINEVLKKKMALAGSEKRLRKVYLAKLPPIYDVPVYFSQISGQGSTIGASLMEKLGLWFDFGRRKIYANATPGLIKTYIQNSRIAYRHDVLKSFGAYRYLPVSINGNAPVNFLIDTGSGISSIDENYAKKIGLRTDDARCLNSASQAGKRSSCYTKDSISINTESKHSLGYLPDGFLVMDWSELIPPLQAKGILGLDWLEGNRVVLSLKESQFYFHDATQKTGPAGKK